MTQPLVLTCGEPAGIGPDLAPLAWQALKNELAFFWLGDPRHLPATAPVVLIDTPAQAADAMTNGLPVLAHDFGPAATPGQANPAHAAHVIAVIEQAVGFVQNAQASALCTAPIHKKALQDGAGFAFPGHTEFLAHLAGQKEVVMMLACAALRVVPATIHIPLAAVPQALTPDLLRQTITLTHHAMQRDFGIAAPRIAVAGLNPHAGEGGAMGQEELRWIAPLLAQMRAGGIDIIGPLPADTMFNARARAGYDVAICMYHDQALIPIKTIDFDHGVNISLGLPFVRTSPDHGTAFDIAGRGQANPSSLIAALRMGAEMAKARQNAQHSQS